jgi:hypothetical protein
MTLAKLSQNHCHTTVLTTVDRRPSTDDRRPTTDGAERELTGTGIADWVCGSFARPT